MENSQIQQLLLSRSLEAEVKEIHNTNITFYAAKNVSNDFNFTKLFLPSNQISKQTLSPTPTLKPTFLSTTEPTSILTANPTIGPTVISSSLKPSDFLITNDVVKTCPTIQLTSDLKKYVTPFSYEIITPMKGVEIGQSLKVLEERILDHAAQNFLKCDEQEKTEDRKLLKEASQIVRIDSDPTDVIDELHIECTADTGITADANVKCTPIIGAMSFYSECSSCSYPEADILASIEEAMDGGAFVDGDIIKEVNYIGTRDTSTSFINEERHEKFSFNLGIVIGLIAFQFIIIGVVLLRRRRRRRNNRRIVNDIWFEDDPSFANIYDEDIILSGGIPVDVNEILMIEEEEEGINVSYVSNALFSKFSGQLRSNA